jgi:hypothetical protein
MAKNVYELLGSIVNYSLFNGEHADANSNRLVNTGVYAVRIVNLFSSLQSSYPNPTSDLFTGNHAQRNFENLIELTEKIPYLISIMLGQRHLFSGSQAQANFEALIQADFGVIYFDKILISLHNHHIFQLTQQTFTALVSASHIKELYEAINLSDNLLTDQKLYDLITAGANAKYLAKAFNQFEGRNAALLTEENRAALIEAGENAERLAIALIWKETTKATVESSSTSATNGRGLFDRTTSQEHETTLLIHLHIPHYRRILSSAIATIIILAPSIAIEDAAVMRNLITKNIVNAIITANIRSLADLEQKIHDANPETLATQFGLDVTQVAEALDEARRELSLSSTPEAAM